MKEEWFVGVRQKYFLERGETGWRNAYGWYDDGHKLGQHYVDSEEKARAVLENAYRLWNGTKTYNEKGERYETQTAGYIGITSVHTKKDDDEMRIVDHIIKKRTVSDWEVVER